MAESRTRVSTRMVGVVIPANKHICIGLTHIYGIGRQKALDICAQANVDLGLKVSALTDTQVETIRKVIETLDTPIEGDLRIEIRKNIEHLKAIRSYRGGRHKRGLPLRGQRTKNNARTRKGPKKLRLKK